MKLKCVGGKKMTIQPAHAARVQPQVCCHLPVKYKIAFSYACILSCAGGLHIIDFMAEVC